ncbi:MAG: alpha/beta hydrolase [Pigmentiphaga sp.]
MTSGTKVWLDYDQEALDKAYDQAVYAANQDILLKRFEVNSHLARSRMGSPQRHSYGPTRHEALDWYAADAPKAPIQLYIHGGAWRGGQAKRYGFLAEMFLAQGIHVVIPDFINVIEADGDLMPMAEQVIRSIRWVVENAASFNGDPARIYLSAHSSGAHLAAVALTTDWEGRFGLPADLIKGAVLISGLYDLKPARLSSRRQYVRFTDEIEEQLSPQRHLDRLTTPLELVCGTHETPEFSRQTRAFAEAVRQSGRPVGFTEAEGYNHFEILETLANPFGIAGAIALRQMGRRGA